MSGGCRRCTSRGEIIIDDVNEEHVTARVSVDEIRQVFVNGPRVTVNRKNRSTEFIAVGVTDGGATLVIPFDDEDGAVRPITAWRK